MKKYDVLISTLFRSHNAGAYLQAFSLQEYLKANNMNPAFVETYDLKSKLKTYRFIYSKPNRSFKGFFHNVILLSKFYFSRRKFKKYQGRGKVQFGVVGSDEIWNIRHRSFTPSPRFYGLDLPVEKLISYAPCSGNVNVSELSEREKKLYRNIEKFDFVSVRDDSTYNVISKFVPSNRVERVLDPTFLIDFNSLVSEKRILKQPYMVVYTYGMSQGKIEEILKFARRKKLDVVSPCFYHSWCDHSLPCSPFDFLNIIKYSECVVTDTFHGTVFSIIFNKNLFVYASGKNKINDIIDLLNLENAKVDEGGLMVREFGEIDYEVVNRKVDRLRGKSIRFIERALGKKV
jgi:hypothetical protein